MKITGSTEDPTNTKCKKVNGLKQIIINSSENYMYESDPKGAHK